MSDDPEEITVAIRKARSDGAIIPGSNEEPCDNCGETVMISPGTQKSIEEGVYPDVIYCLTCAGQAE